MTDNQFSIPFENLDQLIHWLEKKWLDWTYDTDNEGQVILYTGLYLHKEDTGLPHKLYSYPTEGAERE
jgi:hypothetical protein